MFNWTALNGNRLRAQQAARRDGLYLIVNKANVINPRVIAITKIAIHPKGSRRNFMSLGLSWR